ncbi:SixA phosphatase family protein [Nitratifractor sp.]
MITNRKRAYDKEETIKTLYLIRHAKSDWSDGKIDDFERGLRKKGYKDIQTMGSYLALHGVIPDLIISSSALRAQLTADELAKRIDYPGKVHYMEELYLSRPERILNILALQDDQHESIFVVGHNPELTILANKLVDNQLGKMPTLGIVKIDFDIESWSQIEEGKGELDFYIYPNQFRYYMPKQIRAVLHRDESLLQKD